MYCSASSFFWAKFCGVSSCVFDKLGHAMAEKRFRNTGILSLATNVYISRRSGQVYLSWWILLARFSNLWPFIIEKNKRGIGICKKETMIHNLSFWHIRIVCNIPVIKTQPKSFWFCCTLVVLLWVTSSMMAAAQFWDHNHKSMFYHLLWRFLRRFHQCHIVAYRHTATQWLCKQWPFLGNCSVNMFCGNECASNNKVTVGNGVFLCGLCWVVITRAVGAMDTVVSTTSQWATAWAQKLKNLHCW
jgi:hypothetical protein